METATLLSKSELTGKSGSTFEGELARIAKLTVHASVSLGHQRMRLKDLCQLVPGAIIPLQIPCDAPSELLVNDLLLATGDVVRNGDRLGFRVRHLAADLSLHARNGTDGT